MMLLVGGYAKFQVINGQREQIKRPLSQTAELYQAHTELPVSHQPPVRKVTQAKVIGYDYFGRETD
ncbi:hypothetical protein KIMH_06590 [Bombiscardovia apis]|uniref:Uncharacterized protein n=1 Tax=Bombiscardovia apis TaxID=2932182 RepID=A0ABN6SFV9_9BIFI|nr:hypothetical protein [Bombiscardovia apis]BDR54548.1 hypothetical protein KIMH_06590 [Bombiscardovia apis]